MSFTFQRVPTQSPTVTAVRSAAKQGQSLHIVGAAGSGKTHAVRAATSGLDALWMSIRKGPLLGAWFVADLALQLGAEGETLLRTLREGFGLQAALKTADLLIGSRPVVIDDFQRLEVNASSSDDPAPELWGAEAKGISDWLCQRSLHRPVVFVGGSPARTRIDAYRHHAPETWPLKLEGGTAFVTEWSSFMADVARGNPGVQVLARVLLSLAGARVFDAQARRLRDEDLGVGELLRELGGCVLSLLPPSWRRTLSVLAFVEGCPRAILESLLNGASEPAPIDRLLDLDLVEEREGVLTVAASISSLLPEPTDEERATIVADVAERILRPVNSLSSLTPADARRVLHAHAIYLALPDVAAAERTARLHLHGLIDLARRTSLSGNRDQAWRQYDAIHFMLKGGGWRAQSTEDRKTRSYVVHYRTWNGLEARHINLEEALVGYADAVSDWPENALWWQRKLQVLLRLGRVREFRDELQHAYRSVPEHPHRDELLRIRPSATALDVRQAELSLELLEPTLALSPDENPTAVDRRDALLARWSAGVSVDSLSFADVRLFFHQPTKVRITRAALWRARLPDNDIEAEGSSPTRALHQLAADVGKATSTLVSTPSTRLSPADVRRKGRLLALVDVLNSDIGLPITTDRWFAGRIEQGRLHPVILDIDPIEIPKALLPANEEGIFLARAPVLRDGRPSGPIVAIEPAGSSSQSIARLSKLLEQKRGET